MYTGNYPGSPSGYDPNIPTGYNKWDAMESEPRYLPEEEPDIEDDELDFPRNQSLLSENSVTVKNNNTGEMECINDEDE